MPNIVKNTTFVGLLDLLFPHSCRGCGRLGEAFCDCCKNYILVNRQNFCPHCKKENPTGTCPNCLNLPPIYVVSNRNTILGNLIHDYKYHPIRALARPLAELLNSSLPKALPLNSVFVPLPTATHHIRARGFDHTLLLTKRLAKLRHLPYQKIISRNKNTVQVGTNRSTRLSQASSAYFLNPKSKINPDTTYILVDDVWTTGASILSATNLLKKSGAKKIIIALLAYSSY